MAHACFVQRVPPLSTFVNRHTRFLLLFAACPGTALADAIRMLRQRVDKELPGLYTWFADESLHVTIRGLMG
jgi:hypothetical protein